MVQAELLADALAEHGTAPPVGEDFHLAYEEASAGRSSRGTTPRSPRTAPSARTPPASSPARPREPPDPGDEDPEEVQRRFLREVLREGLLPAVRTDGTVFRAFLRGFNLLEAPEALMRDTEVMAKVLEAYQSRDERPEEPSLGPDRDELMRRLAAV